MADKSKPLSGWKRESYDEKGRACSGLDEGGGYDKQMPKLPKAMDTYDASGSADPGRRNK